MATTKRERILEFFKRLKAAGPFSTGSEALAELACVMTEVEDELSGIPKNPQAAAGPDDGRMYPPLDHTYVVLSPHSGVQIYKHVSHLTYLTYIGENGALKITNRYDGAIEMDLSGGDGRTIDSLLAENPDERNH